MTATDQPLPEQFAPLVQFIAEQCGIPHTQALEMLTLVYRQGWADGAFAALCKAVEAEARRQTGVAAQ